MSARDPTPAATAVQIEIDRRMAPSRRCALAVQMSTSGREIIRNDRPFSSEELTRRQLVSMLGTDVATATAKDTIIAKLEWGMLGGSDRQLEDVVGVAALGLDAPWRAAQGR